MSKIGLIISGMPKVPRKGIEGFNNDIVTTSEVEEVKQMLKDERGICNVADANFFSLEKTAGYTLFTIYNPNTFDHVSRDAYIAITLFTNKNETIAGNVTDKLNELMSIYMTNEKNISDQLFIEKISSYSTQPLQASALYGAKLGFKKYTTVAEINNIINTVQTKNFRKLYFFNKNHQIESDSNYLDYDSELKHNVNIRDINANKHLIYLNNKQLKIEWSDTEISIPAFNNDKIIIQQGTKVIEEFDVTRSIDYTIPPQIKRPAPIAPPQIVWYKKYAFHMGFGALIVAFAVVGIIKLSSNPTTGPVDNLDDPNEPTVLTQEPDINKIKLDNIAKMKKDLYNPEKGVYWDEYKQFYFIENDKWYGMKFKLINGDSIRDEKILKTSPKSINALNKYFKEYIEKDIKYIEPDPEPEQTTTTTTNRPTTTTTTPTQTKEEICKEAENLIDASPSKDEVTGMLNKLIDNHCHCDDIIRELKALQ